MKKIIKHAAVIASLSLVSETGSAQMTNSQERFQDFFATAGYGTAFGAALGAATLPFQGNPEKHLRSVAIGASIGFFSGSLLGSYIVFSPSFAKQSKQKSNPLVIAPLLDTDLNIKGIKGSWKLAEF